MATEHDNDNMLCLVRYADEPVHVWAFGSANTRLIIHFSGAGFATNEVLSAVHNGSGAGKVGSAVNRVFVGDADRIVEQLFELGGLGRTDTLCVVPGWIGIIVDEPYTLGHAIVGDDLHD